MWPGFKSIPSAMNASHTLNAFLQMPHAFACMLSARYIWTKCNRKPWTSELNGGEKAEEKSAEASF